MNTHPRFTGDGVNIYVTNVPAGALPGNYLTVRKLDGTTTRVLLTEQMIHHDGTPLDKWRFLGERYLQRAAETVRQRIDKGHLRPGAGEDPEPTLKASMSSADGGGAEHWTMNGYALSVWTIRTPLGPARSWSVAGGEYALRIGYALDQPAVERSGRYIPLDHYFKWGPHQAAVNAGWGFVRLLLDLHG